MFIWALSWALILLGVFLLYIQLKIYYVRSTIRHVETDEFVPSVFFFYKFTQMVLRSFGFANNFDPVESALENKREHGSCWLFWQGLRPILIITDPEDIKRVFLDNGTEFSKKNPFGTNETLLRLLGHSLLAISGDHWKESRKAMEPAFQYAKMRTLAPMFSKTANRLIKKWETKDNQPIPVEDDLNHMTLDAISLGGFSYDFNSLNENDGESLKHFNNVVASIFRPLSLLFPWVNRLPTKYNNELSRSFIKTDELLYGILKEHRANKGDSDNKSKDLLDHIIEMDEKGLLTNQEIRDNIFLFFFAGHETTASALTSALYFLSQYPEIQERLYEEVHDVLGGRTDVTFSDVKKMKFLDAVIKETLRLRAPVGGTTSRIVAKEGVVLGGFKLPVGTQVSPSIWAVHHDENLWEEPFAFKPERFLGKTDANAWIPFSLGPRICIGKRFAQMEMAITLCLLVQKYQFSLVDGYEWKYKGVAVSLRPVDALPLNCHRR